MTNNCISIFAIGFILCLSSCANLTPAQQASVTAQQATAKAIVAAVQNNVNQNIQSVSVSPIGGVSVVLRPPTP